jgi:predicted nuclease of predicted toxin-antitoxin system
MTKLLLDESIPIRLANHFPTPFEVATVHSLGWLGTKNGELLRPAGQRRKL